METDKRVARMKGINSNNQKNVEADDVLQKIAICMTGLINVSQP